MHACINLGSTQNIELTFKEIILVVFGNTRSMSMFINSIPCICCSPSLPSLLPLPLPLPLTLTYESPPTTITDLTWKKTPPPSPVAATATARFPSQLDRPPNELGNLSVQSVICSMTPFTPPSDSCHWYEPYPNFRVVDFALGALATWVC